MFNNLSNSFIGWIALALNALPTAAVTNSLKCC